MPRSNRTTHAGTGRNQYEDRYRKMTGPLPRGAYTEPRDARTTLAQAGISKKLSSRAVAELCGVHHSFVEKLRPTQVATVATSIRTGRG